MCCTPEKLILMCRIPKLGKYVRLIMSSACCFILWYCMAVQYIARTKYALSMALQSRKRSLQSQFLEGSLSERSREDDNNVLAEFSDVTTIHGIRYFAGPDHHWIIRFIWLALTITGCYFSYVTLYPAFKSHIEGDVRTAWFVEMHDEVPFPALTFCNVNNYKRSVVAANYKSLLLSMLLSDWNESDISNICPLEANPISEYLKTYDFVQYELSNLFFHTHDAFQSVVSCKFNNTACNANIVNHMTDLGTCFTYNPGKHFRNSAEMFGTLRSEATVWYPHITGEPVRVAAAGLNTAVDLILNAQVYDYCDAGGPMEEAAGFSVAVHDPAAESWFAFQPYISVEPGLRTEIVVRLKRIQRNTEELKRCVSQMKLDYYPNRTYMEHSCYVECAVKTINEMCQCIWQQAPVGAFQIVQQVMSQANSTNIKDYACMTNEKVQCAQWAERNVTSGKSWQIYCRHCKTACSELLFITEQVSSHKFPSDSTAALFFDKKYPQFGPNTGWEFLDKDEKFRNLVKKYETYFKGNDSFTTVEEVQNNILSVKVYLATIAVETIVEDPLVTIPDLVGQIGGATGLFLGASLLSFAELLHWAFVGMITCVRSQSRMKKD